MNKILEGRHYETGEVIRVTMDDGKISKVDSNFDNQDRALPYIAPGIVDLQINGYHGYDFNTLPLTHDDVETVTKLLWVEGVTSYYPTVITNSDESIKKALIIIAEACEQNDDVNKTIAGIHVEGPFISPEDGPRGAHAKDYVKAPDWELFQSWQEAADGRIKIITISPEWPGSADFIAKCVETGVIVSIGHTAASPEQIQEAISAGATMSTHLGNGAHVMIPRHPNYIWEQLADERLFACLIADGFHLPESFLKVAMKVKGKQAMLVSDAVTFCGLTPGEYSTHIGGNVVLTPEGKLHTADNPKILAGSAQMLNHGINHLVKANLATLGEAWEMASLRPAKFMDLPTQEGIKQGASADLVLFNKANDHINLLKTYKAGKLVFTEN